MNPVKGKIFQKFGAKWIADHDFILNGLQVKTGDDVYKKFFNLTGHNGLDFQAITGETIVAAFDGFIIEQVDKATGYGIRISQRVELGGKYYMAIYGHLLRLEKDISMPWNWEDKSYPVKAGQVIGYVDTTGFSSGDHLHFGMYPTNSNGGYLEALNGYGGCIDPEPLLGEIMNEAKVVKSKKSPTVYICYPVPDPDYLTKSANLQGFKIPNPIPDSDSL